MRFTQDKKTLFYPTFYFEYFYIKTKTLIFLNCVILLCKLLKNVIKNIIRKL